MSVQKTNLNAFRAFLFFFFAGVGCLVPFLSLHLKSSGLNTDEIRVISYAAPLFATLGPLIIGPVVDYLSSKRKAEGKSSSAKSDRNTYVRTVLSVTVLLSAIFYCLLLSVPTIKDRNPRQPEASFVCNERGASLVQEKCNELNCFKFSSEKTGTATLKNCHFNCELPSQYGYIDGPREEGDIERKSAGTTLSSATKHTTISPRPQSIRPEVDISNLDDFFGGDANDDYDDGDGGSGEESEFNWNKNSRQKREAQADSGFSLEESPHICHDKVVKGRSSRTCFVYTPNSADFNVSVILKPFHEDDAHCSYPLGGNFSCRIPRGIEKPNEECKLLCELEKVYSSDNFLLHSQCDQILSDPVFTFWSYLTFRALGDFFFTSSVALLIGAAIVAAGDEAGREFILPSLSYGLFASVVGYLHSDGMSPLQLDNMPNFFIGIVGFGFFLIIALLILIFTANLCIGPPDWWRSTRNVHIRHKAEFYAVLLVLVFLGMLWGPIYFHVPWHITEHDGLELYVGSAAAVGALLSVPLVWKAFKVVDYCGYSNILIGAFTIYILRYTGLLFIENPWVLSIIGCMEAITLCLMLFSAIFYIRHLAPQHLTFTSQALVVAAHFCLGGGFGCLVSSLLSPSDAELEILKKNSTKSIEVDLENMKTENEFEAPYYLVYCVGAVTAAVVAVVYFFLYHCCLKKKCFAPLYRSDHNGVAHDSGENGMYTPLRIIRNGRQTGGEADA